MAKQTPQPSLDGSPRIVGVPIPTNVEQPKIGCKNLRHRDSGYYTSSVTFTGDRLKQAALLSLAVYEHPVTTS